VKGYLVDTNVPSELTRETPDARVLRFLRNADRDSMFLSVMTIGEICKGIATMPVGSRRVSLQHWLDVDVRSWFAGRILPVSEAIAEGWGQMAAICKQQGRPLAVVDGLIAATALHYDLTLVTRNVKDFATLAVEILDPWET
jgi:predicted nucleic acid-binding protein